MGRINPRLERIYSALRPGVPQSVIVLTTRSVDAAVLAEASSTGAQVGSTIAFGNGYMATATREQADALAQLPSTSEVFYDEPVTAFPGAPR